MRIKDHEANEKRIGIQYPAECFIAKQHKDEQACEIRPARS